MPTDAEEYEAKQAELGEVWIRIDPQTNNADLKEYAGQELRVLYGSRLGKHTRYNYTVWVQRPEGGQLRLEMPSAGEITRGSYRKIYFPGGIFMGRTSLMGSIARSIKSGTISRRMR